MSSLFDIKDVNLFFAFLLYELWRRKIQLWVKWKLETFSKSALQFKYDLFKQSQILTSISWFLEMELERMKDFASKRVARNFSIEGSGCFHQLYSTQLQQNFKTSFKKLKKIQIFFQIKNKSSFLHNSKSLLMHSRLYILSWFS